MDEEHIPIASGARGPSQGAQQFPQLLELSCRQTVGEYAKRRAGAAGGDSQLMNVLHVLCRCLDGQGKKVQHGLESSGHHNSRRFDDRHWSRKTVEPFTVAHLHISRELSAVESGDRRRGLTVLEPGQHILNRFCQAINLLSLRD